MDKIIYLLVAALAVVKSEAPGGYQYQKQQSYIQYPPAAQTSQRLEQGYNYNAPAVEPLTKSQDIQQGYNYEPAKLQQGYNYEPPVVTANVVKAEPAKIQQGYSYRPPASTPAKIQEGYNYEPPVVTSNSAASEPAKLQQGYNYDAPVVTANTGPAKIQTASQTFYNAPSVSEPIKAQYTAPLTQSYSAPIQSAPLINSYSVPAQQYNAPLQSAPAPAYSAPLRSAPAPVQSAQLQSAPAPLYSAPIQSAPSQAYSAPSPSAQLNSGYSYTAPSEPLRVAPQSFSAPAATSAKIGGEAELIGSLSTNQGSGAGLKSNVELQDTSSNFGSFTGGYSAPLQSAEGLDSSLIGHIQNAILSSENNARSYSRVVGVSLENPTRSIEVSSFDQSGPFNQIARLTSPSGGYNYQSASAPIVSAPGSSYGLPSVVDNRSAAPARLSSAYGAP